MNRTFLLTSAAVIAALSLPALPAAAQERRAGGHPGGGGGRVASAPPASRGASAQPRFSAPRPSFSAPPARAYEGGRTFTAPQGRSYTAPRATFENRSFNQPRATFENRSFGPPQALPRGSEGGRVNGTPQALPRGSEGGRVNGAPQALPQTSAGGRVNGTPQALPRGSEGGRVNGTPQALPRTSEGGRIYTPRPALPGTSGSGTYAAPRAIPRQGGTYRGGSYPAQRPYGMDGSHYGMDHGHGYGDHGGNYWRPTMVRPYYSHLYTRPYGWRPYYPYHFVRPYYAFSPWLDLGFGIWVGYPVPYPWVYLGDYQPTVFGYDSGDYQVVAGSTAYGGVSFDVQPADANLFVDGQYVGVVGSFGPANEPLTLTPGTHQIAIQREGYIPLQWEVTIEAGQVIPYRGVLDRQ